MKRPLALVILLFVSCNFVDAQVIMSASVVAKGVNGAPATFVTELSNEGLGFSCDVRLEFVDNTNPPNSSNNAIWEVNDDINSNPERMVFSDCPSAALTFSQTPTTNNSLFEDQTAYVWARKAMVYAQTALWPNSPGKLSTAGLRPFVLKQFSFGLACVGATPTTGCSRAFPNEGPRMYLLSGSVNADLIVHEYGHYAAGYVFGHQDAFGLNGFDITSCIQLAWQEGVAETFDRLFFHNEFISTGVAMPSGVPGESRVFTGVCKTDVHETGFALAEAFDQTVWGTGSGSLKVSWPDPATANIVMAKAFASGLGSTSDQRLQTVATAALTFIKSTQSASILAQVTAIFAAHGLAPLSFGGQCTDNTQCSSKNCDAGDGTSKTGLCVPPPGTGTNATLCTNDKQCISGRCAGLHTDMFGKWISGTCAPKIGLGLLCSGNNNYCASGYCDSGTNTGNTNECLPKGGVGQVGDPCSHDTQCMTGVCKGLGRDATGGTVPGACANAFSFDSECSANSQCASGYCDTGDGTSKTNKCLPRGGTGGTGDLCSNSNQCGSGRCDGLSKDDYGQWILGRCSASAGPLAATCSNNSECASDYCDTGDGTSKTNECMPKGGIGMLNDPCSNSNQCASRACGGLSQDGYGNWHPGKCSTPGSLGATCSGNSDCRSTYCDAGDGTSKTNKCMPRGGTGHPNDPCSNNNQCINKTCNGLKTDSSGNWVSGVCN
jgi:hypothetical protein